MYNSDYLLVLVFNTGIRWHHSTSVPRGGFRNSEKEEKWLILCIAGTLI